MYLVVMLSMFTLLDFVKGEVSTLLGMSWFWQVNIIQSIWFGSLLLLVNLASMKRKRHILKPRSLAFRTPSQEIFFLIGSQQQWLHYKERVIDTDGLGISKISQKQRFLPLFCLTLPFIQKQKASLKQSPQIREQQSALVRWWICIYGRLNSTDDKEWKLDAILEKDEKNSQGYQHDDLGRNSWIEKD